MDLKEIATQALFVAIFLAVMRAIIQRVPGPISRLGAWL